MSQAPAGFAHPARAAGARARTRKCPDSSPGFRIAFCAVLDRNTAIAHIVPIRERTALRIRKPASGTPAPNKVPLPKPARLDLDIVSLLIEERQSHR